MPDILSLIKKPVSKIFRRAFIKRRQSDGTYESTWTEISEDVKTWGSITIGVDATQFNRFRFSGLQMKVSNDNGKYNDESFQSSLWYGYSSPQRSLVRIEVGYVHETLASSGIYTKTEYPNDGSTASSSFIGVLVGDMPSGDKNTVPIPVAPLTEVFRQFPAEKLTGAYTSTGMTAQLFIEKVRDFQDGNGAYVFRPFFGDTTSGFDIASTTVSYTGLNTAGSGSVASRSVWDIIQQLAEAEGFTPYVDSSGIFHFSTRAALQSTSSYSFYGVGQQNNEYGINIKSIDKYGLKYTKFYSQVRVKFADADTYTSYYITGASLTVASNSLPWLYGHKSIEINNTWIPNTATAITVANSVYDQVKNLKAEIEFTAPLVPQLTIFDRIDVSYDLEDASDSLWDAHDWAPTPDADGDHLIWDGPVSGAIYLQNEEFALLSISHNLDSLETKIVARDT